MGDGLLVRVAAGPRIGFGHLVRAVSLCRAAGVPPVVSLRGGRIARAAARRLGCVLVDTPPTRTLARRTPSVLVVDDPHDGAAQPWVRAARRLNIPIAALRDQGIGARGADLVIDGSPGATDISFPGRHLCGPRFMVLDPVFATRRRRPARRARRARVAVALGGGIHASYAQVVTQRLERTLGPDQISVAAGFTNGRSQQAGAGHARWLANADMAVVAGGIGLYEACCLGVPAVAVAVTREQRPTVRAFAERGAVIDGGLLRPGDGVAARRVASCVLRLLEDRNARRQLAARARRLVDGRGGARVAAALGRLAARATDRPGRRSAS